MKNEDVEKIDTFLKESGLSFKLLKAKKNYNYYVFSVSVETKSLGKWVNFLITHCGIETQWQIVPYFLHDAYQTIKIWDFRY
jgi:hypothetical protein